MLNVNETFDEFKQMCPKRELITDGYNLARRSEDVKGDVPNKSFYCMLDKSTCDYITCPRLSKKG